MLIFIFYNIFVNILSFFIFDIFFEYNQNNFWVILHFNLLLSIIFYFYKNNFFSHITFILFLFSFYFFNLLGYFVNFFESIDNMRIISFAGELLVSKTSMLYSLKLLYIVILVLFITYILFYRLFYKNYICSHKRQFRTESIRIASISFYVMMFGSIFAFLKGIVLAWFVLKNGYLAMYLLENNAFYLNPIIDIFDGFFFLGACSYYATNIPPNPPKEKIISILLLVYSFIELLSGARRKFMSLALFIIWYKIKSANLNQSLIRKKFAIAISSLFIIFISFMAFVGKIRLGKAVDLPYVDFILDFLKKQNTTGRILALFFDYQKDIIPSYDGKLATLAPLRDFIANNSISRLFTEHIFYDRLQFMNIIKYLSMYISYMSFPLAFMTGGGLASNYIAELYFDGGILLVVAYNIALSIIFAYFEINIKKKWGLSLIFMYIYPTLLYLPRNPALSFLPMLLLPLIYILFMSVYINLTGRRSYEN